VAFGLGRCRTPKQLSNLPFIDFGFSGPHKRTIPFELSFLHPDRCVLRGAPSEVITEKSARV